MAPAWSDARNRRVETRPTAPSQGGFQPGLREFTHRCWAPGGALADSALHPLQWSFQGPPPHPAPAWCPHHTRTDEPFHLRWRHLQAPPMAPSTASGGGACILCRTCLPLPPEGCTRSTGSRYPLCGGRHALRWSSPSALQGISSPLAGAPRPRYSRGRQGKPRRKATSPWVIAMRVPHASAHGGCSSDNARRPPERGRR